jgi:RimJ/RimL family protein N-acetyltransferase
MLEPHVLEWWHEPLDHAAIHAKYGPRVDGLEPTHVFIIEYRQQPIGWIQWYRWGDYPEHAKQLGAEPNSAGIDLAIGEQAMLGMGLGAKAITKIVDEVVFADAAITALICDPEVKNVRSLGAFKKAGFVVTKTVQLRGENFQRNVVRLNRPDRG